MWCPRWQIIGSKSLGQLENFGTRFSLGQTLNMGQIRVRNEIIHWIVNIPTNNLWKLILVIKLSPQEH